MAAKKNTPIITKVSVILLPVYNKKIVKIKNVVTPTNYKINLGNCVVVSLFLPAFAFSKL